MKKQLLVTLLAIFALSACAPDPRKEAQAYAIRSEADQQAYNNETARKQSEELQRLNVERQEIDLQKERVNAAVWNAIADTFLTSLAALFLVVMTGIAYEITRASRGVSDAVSQAALTRANLIYLNPTTRQFPLLIKQVSTHKFAIHNPNTGSVKLLDERNPEDRQMIAAASLTQVTGVLASEARQSNDPAGMALIHPPVLDTNADGMWIGDSFLKNAIPLNGDDHAG